MKKNFSKILITILTIISIGLVITLVIIKFNGIGKKSDNEILNDKILAEIGFVDSNIVDAMNKLNNISIVRYKVYTKSINTSESDSKSNNGEFSESQSKNEDFQNSKGNEKSSGQNSQGNGNIQQNDGVNNSNQTIKVSQSLAVNSLEETSETNIDWNTITSIYENLYSTWPALRLDLQRLGMTGENIEKYNLSLNGIAQSINAKNKNSCLINFYNLYAQIPSYMIGITNDAFILNLYNTKLGVLNAYALAGSDKWEEMNASVLSSKSAFSTIVNSMDSSDKRKDNIEKVNIMIDNLQKSVNLNDKKIFYIHYKDVMQELETL